MPDHVSATAAEAERLRTLYDKTMSEVAESQKRRATTLPAPAPEHPHLPKATAADAERLRVLYNQKLTEIAEHREGQVARPKQKPAEPIPASALRPPAHSVR